MIRCAFKQTIWLIIAFVAINVLMALLTNVSSQITHSDEAQFSQLFDAQELSSPFSYEQELHLIKSIQTRVFNLSPGSVPIPEYQNREPEDLFREKSGVCYDRSRTLDKILKWYGFQVRHIYILYANDPKTGERLSWWRALFTKGTQSHAVTEVKTSRGWLVVDSNSQWISVAADGTPIDADHITERADSFSWLPESWTRPYWAIRGLYSRRGQFYRPYLPYPALNWYDFFTWLVNG